MQNGINNEKKFSLLYLLAPLSPCLCVPTSPTLFTFCSSSLGLHNGLLSSLKIRLRIPEFRCQILITDITTGSQYYLTICSEEFKSVSWCLYGMLAVDKPLFAWLFTPLSAQPPEMCINSHV